MRLRILLLLVLLPVPVAGQGSASRLEIGTEWSYWRLDMGTASNAATTRPTATLRLGVPLTGRAGRVVQVGATYAPEGDVEPGLLHLEAEVAPRLIGARSSAPDLFVSAGVGALRFAADRQQERIAECGRTPTCMFEGIPYRSGWRPTLSAGLGADLPLADAVLVQPALRVIRLVGGGEAGPDEAPFFLRFGIGVTWRIS